MSLSADETVARLKNYETENQRLVADGEYPGLWTEVVLLGDNNLGVASVEPNGDDATESDGFAVEPAVYAKLSELPSFVPDNRMDLAAYGRGQRQVELAAVIAALQS
ncbi:hypothetical protein [Hymenobacter nivis]|uniref:Uncharacterized protein n=1 Tax=Hymenobacter nivis TaxID=1850093 RepID=A0A2Z3GK86_9BACT|nr:hypothetical protein [Hymenobacter nivis]AWM32117.1 hypothetical protein DDQ68_04495 [Hymenobacter nivis]